MGNVLKHSAYAIERKIEVRRDGPLEPGEYLGRDAQPSRFKQGQVLAAVRVNPDRQGDADYYYDPAFKIRGKEVAHRVATRGGWLDIEHVPQD